MIQIQTQMIRVTDSDKRLVRNAADANELHVQVFTLLKSEFNDCPFIAVTVNNYHCLNW